MPDRPSNTHKLLGRLAVELDMIDVGALTGVLLDQQRRAAEGERVKIGRLLIERGLITGHQLQRLLAAQREVQSSQRVVMGSEGAGPQRSRERKGTDPARPAQADGES